jgi:hypothetical protein
VFQLLAVLKNSWLFPVIESIHLCGVALLVGTIVLRELRSFGLLLADEAVSRRIPRVGLAVVLSTGPVMFFSDTSRYLHNPAFRFKIALVVLALASYFAPRRTPHRSKWAAVLSIVLWTGAVLAARAIADFDL